MSYTKLVSLITGILLALSASAKITFPAIIGNNMVLQQESQVPLWGKAVKNSTVEVITSWNRQHYKTRSDKNGQWRLMINTPAAGGPYDISFNDGSLVQLTNILIGEVWVCSGQSNMEISMKGYGNQPILNSNDILMKADNPQLRLFHVKRAVANSPQQDCKGSWVQSSSETASSFSAVGYQYAEMLQRILKVPVGIIEASWGGTPIEAWMDKASLKAFPQVKTPDENESAKADRLNPTCLFNGMIAPISGYGIKGFLWYQGETNVPHPYDYEQLMVSMVREWRSLWRQDSLPFYYVQIAPWKYRENRDSVPYLREAQQRAENKLSNAGMVVSIDAGNEFTIHPPDKTIISKRLLYWAMGNTYHEIGVAYESPVFDSMYRKGNTLVLKFKHAVHGFTSHDENINGFSIAGSDKMYYPASARIYKNTIIVKSDSVSAPLNVRYAFKDWVEGNLYNTEGLPVAPFRTDDY